MDQNGSLKERGISATSDELSADIGTAAPGYIEGALSNPDIDEGHIVLLLNNPSLTGRLIEKICDEQKWMKIYKIRAAIVNHPKTPRHLALNFVKFLFWRDLLKVIDNPKLSPPLRRNAEELLKEQAKEMAAGEQIALARFAGRPIIKMLRESKDPRIIDALLKNWRTIEEDVMMIVKNERTPSNILSLVSKDYKWSARYHIRMALLINQKTPIHDSLRSLKGLPKKELLALKGNQKLRKILRVAASRILA